MARLERAADKIEVDTLNEESADGIQIVDASGKKTIKNVDDMLEEQGYETYRKKSKSKSTSTTGAPSKEDEFALLNKKLEK